jgi:hypothetical protein
VVAQMSCHLQYIFSTQAVRLVADYKINLRGIDYDNPEYEKIKAEVSKIYLTIAFLALWNLLCKNIQK